jgi:hypothetical protein
MQIWAIFNFVFILSHVFAVLGGKMILSTMCMVELHAYTYSA